MAKKDIEWKIKLKIIKVGMEYPSRLSKIIIAYFLSSKVQKFDFEKVMNLVVFLTDITCCWICKLLKENQKKIIFCIESLLPTRNSPLHIGTHHKPINQRCRQVSE